MAGSAAAWFIALWVHFWFVWVCLGLFVCLCFSRALFSVVRWAPYWIYTLTHQSLCCVCLSQHFICGTVLSLLKVDSEGVWFLPMDPSLAVISLFIFFSFFHYFCYFCSLCCFCSEALSFFKAKTLYSLVVICCSFKCCTLLIITAHYPYAFVHNDLNNWRSRWDLLHLMYAVEY